MASTLRSADAHAVERLETKRDGAGQGQAGESLSHKIQNALNEARILVLGAQVLTGAAFESTFQDQFEKLPAIMKDVHAAGLGAMLLVLILLEEQTKTSITDKVSQVLTEARVVLPGAQAVLGFQFVAMLSQQFSRLPESSKLIHIGSLASIGLATIWLMTPAAYHRLVEDGESTPSFHRFASRMLLLAMVALALGLCGDFFVVPRIVTESPPISAGSAALMLLVFLGCWFGLTTFPRQRHDRQQVQIA